MPNSRHATFAASRTSTCTSWTNSSAATVGIDARISARFFCVFAFCFGRAVPGICTRISSTSVSGSLAWRRSVSLSADRRPRARDKGSPQIAFFCLVESPPFSSGSARIFRHASTALRLRETSASFKATMQLSAPPVDVSDRCFFFLGEMRGDIAAEGDGPCSLIWSHQSCSRRTSKLPSLRQPWNAHVRTEVSACASFPAGSSLLDCSFSAASGGVRLAKLARADCNFVRQAERSPTIFVPKSWRPVSTGITISSQSAGMPGKPDEDLKERRE
mmetsp:Transcript_53303/g.86182  ORF Transcript_53303/g.86182 Transcript_53303/m.86182 type:complete len:274 (+) Transcript_53303:1883-2704(+)